jgi:hypothetical protein
MKNTITIGVITVSFFLAGCGHKHSTSLSVAAHKVKIDEETVVAQSQVIAYASAYTNNAPDMLLTIDEIWKGSHDASRLGITNGSQIPFRWPVEGGVLPDGAIVFIPQQVSNSTVQLGPGTTFVRAGRVGGIHAMTVQEYKIWIGKLANGQ